MNIKTLIAQVRSQNKYIFDDDLISDRRIFNIARTIASTLVKREVNLRKLLNSDSIFTPIECLHLKTVDLTECGINSYNKVRRSNEPLPPIEEGIYGYTIQGVYNLDNSEEILPTTNRQYINISKFRVKPKKALYLIKNNYLYILDPDIQNVNLYIYTPDNSFQLSDCQSMYDADLKIPNYLTKSLYDMINAELINYHKYPKDITDNNLEEENR